MSKDVNIGVQAIKAFTGKVGQAAVGFLGTILFARALGPTGLGGYYLLLTLVKFADRPVHGFAHAVKKRYSEYDAPEAEIFGVMVFVGGVYVLVGGGVAFLLREQLRRLTAVPDAWLLFTLLLATATAFHTVQKVLAGQGLVGVQTWNDTLRSLLTLPLQILVVVQTAVVGEAPLLEVFVSESQRCVVQTGAGSAGMAYGLAAATALVLPIGLYYLRLRPAIPSWETLRSVGAFARYSVFSSVVGKTQGRFDILLLGGFVGTAAIGAYEVADRLTVPALFLAGVATTGLMTKVSNRHSQGESFLPDVANVLSYASLFAVPLFFGAVAIGDAVVRTFYGGEFAGAAAVLVGLAAGQLVTTQASVYRTTLDGIDEPRVGLRINTAALVVNVALGLLLVVPFGVLGVVAATVVADAVKLVVSVRALRARVGGVTVAPRPFQAQLLSGAVMGVVTAGARRLFPVGSLTDLLVLVGVGGAVYFGCLAAVSTHFRGTVVGVVGDTLTDLRSE